MTTNNQIESFKNQGMTEGSQRGVESWKISNIMEGAVEMSVLTREIDRDDYAEVFGKDLRKVRLEEGLNVAEVSEKTGMKKSTLYNYENGHNLPGAFEIRKLCEALGCTPTRLIYGTDDLKEIGKQRSPGAAFLDVGNEEAEMMRLVFALSAIKGEEKKALGRLVVSLAEARIGKSELLKLGELSDIVAESMSESVLNMVENDLDVDEIDQKIRQKGLDLGLLSDKK